MDISEIYSQVLGSNWPSDEKLVEYAIKGHCFGGDDGYYGVTYPSDLDEYQRVVDGEFIEIGFVELSFWDGSFQTLHVTEVDYLTALQEHLENGGKSSLAKIIENKISAITTGK
jgi:hypothetical protein